MSDQLLDHLLEGFFTLIIAVAFVALACVFAGAL